MDPGGIYQKREKVIFQNFNPVNRLIFLFLTLLSCSFSMCQQPSQTVRGKIFDGETNYPLFGAKAEVLTGDSVKRFRAMSDVKGNFIIDQVPVGKYQLEVKLSTYELKSVTIEVTSGKECIVNIPLNERIIEQKEVTITARKKGR